MSNDIADNVNIVTQGEKAEFPIYLDNRLDGRPFDLTNFDEFTLKLPLVSGSNDYLSITQSANANGSSVVKTTPNECGRLDVTLGAADTQNLNPEFNQDMFLELNNSGTPNPKRIKLERALHVNDFPAD